MLSPFFPLLFHLIRVWAENSFHCLTSAIIVNRSFFHRMVNTWNNKDFTVNSMFSLILQFHVPSAKWLLCFCLDCVCHLAQMCTTGSSRKSRFSKTDHRMMSHPGITWQSNVIMVEELIVPTHTPMPNHLFVWFFFFQVLKTSHLYHRDFKEWLLSHRSKGRGSTMMFGLNEEEAGADVLM